MAGWRTEDKRALNSLGWMYQNGLGVKQDYTRALFWHLRAAEKGDSAAQNNTGWMYRYGLGVEQDRTMAIFWYQKAAKQGLAAALVNLNTLHLNSRA